MRRCMEYKYEVVYVVFNRAAVGEAWNRVSDLYKCTYPQQKQKIPRICTIHSCAKKAVKDARGIVDDVASCDEHVRETIENVCAGELLELTCGIKKHHKRDWLTQEKSAKRRITKASYFHHPYNTFCLLLNL